MKCCFPFSVFDKLMRQSPAAAGLLPARLLTFAELVAPSGLLAAGFFPLNGSRVTAQQAGSFEGGPEFGVDFEQGAGDTKLGGFSLALDPATGGVDLHIILVGKLDCLERQFDLILEINQREILFVILIVDDDLTITFTKEDPGYGFLAATNGVLLPFHLLVKIRKLKLWVAVLRAGAGRRRRQRVS